MNRAEHILLLFIEHQEESVPFRQHLHVLVGRLELIEVIEDISNTSQRIDNLRNGERLGPLEAVVRKAINDALLLEVRKVCLSDRGGEEGVETIDTVVGVVTGQMTEKELGKSRAEGTIGVIASAILESPCSEVGG